MKMEKTELIYSVRAELDKAGKIFEDLEYSVNRGDPNMHEQQIILLAFTKGIVTGAMAMIDLMLERAEK
jgi:hypothetical protein